MAARAAAGAHLDACPWPAPETKRKLPRGTEQEALCCLIDLQIDTFLQTTKTTCSE